MSALRSPICSPPHHCAPTQLSLISRQYKLQERATPFHIATHRCKNVSLALREIFSPCTHLVLTSAFSANRLNSSHPLKAATLPIEDLEDGGGRSGASLGGEGVGRGTSTEKKGGVGGGENMTTEEARTMQLAVGSCDGGNGADDTCH